MPSESWQTILNQYASKAGFSRAEHPRLEGAPDLPEGCQFWRSNYALLLAIPLSEASEGNLRRASMLGQEWLDVTCMAQERTDYRVLDAYLLLVLEAGLPENMFAAVQEIEFDTAACRKHVAWPYSGDDQDIVWRRLLRVTALGLPSSPAASGMTNTPSLSTELQKQLLRDVKEFKGKTAARQHVELPLDDLI